MPSSLSLGESWQLETHSLRAQMSGICLWQPAGSLPAAGIVERSNGEGRARSWMFEGKSRLQMFPNRCNLFPVSSKPCIAPHTAPCIHHLWSPASRRHRLESELHSLQDLFRTQKCQRQKIWEIVLSIALAWSHIFMRGVHCS